ncbi:hypothetical protein TWF281_000580 [Arthrobotrys megalospora]
MGSNLSIINDTSRPVLIWIFLSGFRTINWGGTGDIPTPLKVNKVESGQQIRYGLGKVWYDVDISPSDVGVPGTLYSKRGLYLGSDVTIRLSTWLGPRINALGSDVAVATAIDEGESVKDSEETGARNLMDIAGGYGDPKKRPDNPVLLTRDCIVAILARLASEDDAEGAKRMQDSIQTLMDVGITVEIEKVEGAEGN